jgi:hypothetical protein
MQGGGGGGEGRRRREGRESDTWGICPGEEDGGRLNIPRVCTPKRGEKA